MPSHIFTRVGLCKELIDTNLRSAAAAKAENNQGEALHAMDYMVYADLQLARDADALAVVKDTLRLVHSGSGLVLCPAAIPARYAVERDDGGKLPRLPIRPQANFPIPRR